MGRFELAGKVALVTGGARGIGLATAQALSARGASVAIVDIDPGAADRAAGQLSGRSFGIGADVSDRGAMQQAVAAVVERLGGLDVVVANAGVAPRMLSFRVMAAESFERVLEVNLMGVCRTVDAALPQIVSRGGHVVVVSSVYAFVNGAGSIPYAMSKAAVEQLGRALRLELRPHGASATVALFGFIETEMLHRTIDDDPAAGDLLAVLPRPLHKRAPAQAAARAIVQGIERRRPRVVRPRRWAAVSVLRGIVNPIADLAMERDASVQRLVEQIDARAGQDRLSA